MREKTNNSIRIAKIQQTMSAPKHGQILLRVIMMSLFVNDTFKQVVCTQLDIYTYTFISSAVNIYLSVIQFYILN
jgi:hypothetical protein